MSVDDVPVGLLYTKGIHNHVHHLFIVSQFEVEALRFYVCALVGNEIAFEGGHLALVEQGRVGATPQVQKVVDGVVIFFGCGLVLEGSTYHHFYLLEQFFAFVVMFGAYFHVFQRSVFVQGDGGMKEQVVVEYGIHASVL